MTESGRIGAFIVGEADGPHPQPGRPGLLRYFFPVTLVPVEPIEDLRTELSVVITRMWRIGLSGGSDRVDTPEGEADLARRLWHWIIPQIPGLLEQLRAEDGVELQPTVPDLEHLIKLVTKKLPYSPAVPIPLATQTGRPRQVFISCGQATPEEIALGKEIAALVSSVPGLRGYFAQNQDSPAAVTDQILKALNESVALVCVMHRRGEVSGRDGKKSHRASVWIEQEIALAAFIEQVLKRPLTVRLYCEQGIAVEGLRRQIMVHEVPFNTPQDVLDNLRGWLPKLNDIPAAGRGALPVEEENRLIEEGIRAYHQLGSPKPFLDRYPSVPPQLKRRMHDLILRAGRAVHGQDSPDTPEEKLRALYPDE